VVKGRVPRQTFDAAVDFIASSICRFCAPADKMIIENPFVKLVVDIGGEALEYVGVR